MRNLRQTKNLPCGAKRAHSPKPNFGVRTLLLTGLLPTVTLVCAAAMTQPHASARGKARKPGAARAVSGVAASAQAGFAQDVLPLVKKFCVGCHSGPHAQAGIDLAGVKTAAGVLKASGTWERVAQNVRSGHMPPAGMPAPTRAQRDALANWVETTADAAACQLHDPGHVTLRRLNRAEYDNTVRDLCGVDIHPADQFPNDDVGYGFDNIGDVLSISPLLMEKYINAAEKVAHAAFQNPDDFLQPSHFGPTTMIYLNKSQSEDGHATLAVDDSEVGIDFTFPQTADYLVRAIAYQSQAGPDPAKMQMKLDGKALSLVDVKNTARDPQPYAVRINVPAGMHRFSVVFTNDYYDNSDPDNKEKRHRDRNLYINAMEVVGPLHGADSPSPLKKRLDDIQRTAATPAAAARLFLSDFARRAYRRPVTSEEIAHLLRYVDLAQKQGASFSTGIEYAMTAALCSPKFLFRVESNAALPAEVSGKARVRTAAYTGKANKAARDKDALNDYALASRLSYFLWSSMPDDELFRLAAQGKLQNAGVLAAQVKRMLADPRARALTDNFAGQWLQLRSLDNVSPDPQRFPDFNADLRRAMQTETEMFFQSIVSEDRSVLDFLDARYTFLNEPLAKHYGIAGVLGPNFRRVMLTGDERGGLLGQASLLTVTSNPTRTSPVKRGKWVMENLLGTRLPPQPPNIPALADDKPGPLVGTLRQRMEQHRKNPICASCHARMDPIGFGLENYNAVGAWRTQDGDSAIDASGVLPDGAKFSGPAQLKQVLKGKKSLFVHCLAAKLLTYALGRGITPADKCAVDTIVRTTMKDDYRFGVLVTAIVQSDPFRKQRRDGGA